MSDQPTDDVVNQIVRRFDLLPHPEGGYYREIYRCAFDVEHPRIPSDVPAQRRAATSIYFLLAERQFSAFHRVRWSDEIWHLYAGGPLEVHLIDSAGQHSCHTLISDPLHGQPMLVVPAGCWQAARPAPRAPWAFMGCTVAPGFEFADFDMPPAGDLLTRFPEHAAIVRELTRG